LRAMLEDSDKTKATLEWIDSMKSENSRHDYRKFWNYWTFYCQQEGLPSNGDELLADMKRRRLSNDNTEKYFYDNEIIKFFKWLQTEYKGKRTGKPLSESKVCLFSRHGSVLQHRNLAFGSNISRIDRNRIWHVRIQRKRRRIQ